MLVAAGAVGALLHLSFRWPLQLPGHHGLEWLAILMTARMLSQRQGAALTVALGAAATTLAFGGLDNVLRPSIYLLQGAALDGLWLLLRGRATAVWLALPLGALVHALSPMMKNLLAVAGGTVSGSLAQGLAWPLMTHALFGGIGALVGACAVKALRHPRARR